MTTFPTTFGEYAQTVVKAGDDAIAEWDASAQAALNLRRETEAATAKAKNREAELRVAALEAIEASGQKSNAEYRENQCRLTIASDDQHRALLLEAEVARGGAQLAEHQADVALERARLRRAEVALLTALIGGRP